MTSEHIAVNLIMLQFLWMLIDDLIEYLRTLI